MRATVIDRDRGWKKFVQEMRAIKGAHTKVGVQAGTPRSGDSADMVTVAAANEFGTHRIPERSFLRSTFDESEGAMSELKAQLVSQIQAGTLTTPKALAILGEAFQIRVQQKIRSGVLPPNSAVTIRRKGSSGTLRDSGQLLQSIRHEESV